MYNITIRWYGDEDPVTLDKIKQFPVVTGIVSDLFNIPVGEIWPYKRIMKLKNRIESDELKLCAIESIPVHEDIKLGLKTRDKYIDNYVESLKNAGKAGVDIVVYNFMPVFDWLRSDLDHENPDGSSSLAYEHDKLVNLDFEKDLKDMPAWAGDYTKDDLRDLMDQYSNVDKAKLWENLEYFLKEVIPKAEKFGVKLAIHPDDPPWDIFGLPRIITEEKSFERVVNIIDSPSNCVTLCTGSIGANRDTDLLRLTKFLVDKKRVPFVHLRNIKFFGDKNFKETAHPTIEGDIDIYGVLKILVENDFDGIIRPDHGRNIWGEEARPGYGLYDRALGAMYIAGVMEALKKKKYEK